MNKILQLITIFLLLTSCGIQHHLKKSFTNKPASILREHFGDPITIFKQNNDSIYIYERTTKLQGTEISQGKLTMDPILTPQVIKTERFYFTIKNGIIINSRYEEEYDR